MLILALLVSSQNSAEAPRNLLSGAHSSEQLKTVLRPRERWVPFPQAGDRDAWTRLPERARAAHLERGVKALSAEWQPLTAGLFLEFIRTGNRSRYESVRRSRREKLGDLVIAECIEGRRRFLDEVVNGIWLICEESYWGVPAHMSLQKAGAGLPDVAEPTVDLFAAETASLLAWTDYLLGPDLEKISPLVRERIWLEINRRILTPNLDREDFWWMGLSAGRRVNNWNPWINSNWLTCVLLLERNEERRVQAVHKILRSLDSFLNDYPNDGGCDEGPGYWGRAGASLFDCLELLYNATKGGINLYGVPLVQEIGRYIYRVHIDDRYFVNFADASARITIPADLVYRYGRRIGDEKMSAFGALAAQQANEWGLSESIGRQLYALFNLDEILKAQAAQPLLRDVWLPELQVMAARSKEGSTEGLYVAAKGGHNAESHNHNDVGNFIVYVNGKPALIDAGVETYTAKTFSSKRYEIWTMQSAYHNLPTINGVMQKNGREFAAANVHYSADDQSAQLSLDIAGAYPPEAGLVSWRRTIQLLRGKELRLVETYNLKQTPSQITLTLMTPCKVVIDPSGKIHLQPSAVAPKDGVNLTIEYDAGKLTAFTEEMQIEDHRLKSVWGERLTRILLRAAHPPTTEAWTLRIY